MVQHVSLPHPSTPRNVTLRYQPLASPFSPPWQYFAYYAPGLELNYTWRDLARCANHTIVRSAWDFVLCIDFTAASTR